MNKQSKKPEPANSVEMLRCIECGEMGRCQNIENPDTGKTEYWVLPERRGKCKKYLHVLCKTRDFRTERDAIRAWNAERGKGTNYG